MDVDAGSLFVERVRYYRLLRFVHCVLPYLEQMIASPASSSITRWRSIDDWFPQM